MNLSDLFQSFGFILLQDVAIHQTQYFFGKLTWAQAIKQWTLPPELFIGHLISQLVNIVPQALFDEEENWIIN